MSPAYFVVVLLASFPTIVVFGVFVVAALELVSQSLKEALVVSACSSRRSSLLDPGSEGLSRVVFCGVVLGGIRELGVDVGSRSRGLYCNSWLHNSLRLDGRRLSGNGEAEGAKRGGKHGFSSQK